MKRVWIYGVLLAAVFPAVAQIEDAPPVIVDYFYEPGCPDCTRVRNQVMPELQERFEGFFKINKHDIGIKKNVIKLVAYQEKLGIKKNEAVMMVVDYHHVFNGFKAIKDQIFDQLDRSVEARQEPGWKAAEPIIPPQKAEDKLRMVENRVSGYTGAAVAIAGLTDGINPCAIGTLVFFMSLLAASSVRGRGLFLMGVSFCLASFVTYTAIGFGLLRFLHVLSGFEYVRLGIEIVLIGILAILAYLSFRDAYRYKLSEKAEDIALQLPRRIKLKIHSIMRGGVIAAKSHEKSQKKRKGEVNRGLHGSTRIQASSRSRHRSRGTKRDYAGHVGGRLVFGGLLIGTAVTALESVCTGQVYVPTLVLVIKAQGGTVAKAWKYLLLYNAMFILPLVVIFVLIFFGLRTQTLLDWSNKNVVVSKVLLGLFFLGMAVLIAAMR